MKTENVIDFNTYRKQFDIAENKEPIPQMSEELKSAIQMLIVQLREFGPLR